MNKKLTVSFSIPEFSAVVPFLQRNVYPIAWLLGAVLFGFGLPLTPIFAVVGVALLILASALRITRTESRLNSAICLTYWVLGAGLVGFQVGGLLTALSAIGVFLLLASLAGIIMTPSSHTPKPIHLIIWAIGTVVVGSVSGFFIAWAGGSLIFITVVFAIRYADHTTCGD